MKINIYVLSNKFEIFYKDAIKEYDKRLSRYCKINLYVLKSKNILPSYKIQISTKGQNISSEQLAQKINQFAISGKSNISFILSDEFEDIDEIISISPMKMDEGLLATITYEQIYRAFRIINNQTYHK